MKNCVSNRSICSKNLGKCILREIRALMEGHMGKDKIRINSKDAKKNK